ncbi:hypothetical protein Hanom_Chr13g01225391 [Helianthus anomalus]
MEYVDDDYISNGNAPGCELSPHQKKYGGEKNLQLERSELISNCRCQEDWNDLCDYWELDSTQVSLLNA